MTALQYTWFWLIGILIVGFTVLDGFDLGVGIWHLFTKDDGDRRRHLQAIGPFWDGNEVWLITAGAAAFAAFPPVYATVFSGMYLALMLVLLALILRVAAIEFRGKEDGAAARRRWDLTFGLSSLVATLLFGVALGNLLRGLPLDAQGNFTGTFFTLLNPFALLVGLTNVAMIAQHGALYLVLRTAGDHQQRAKRWAQAAWSLTLPLLFVTILSAGLFEPHLLANYAAHPLLWALPALAVIASLLAGLWNGNDQPQHAFTASTLSITLLLVSAVTGLFPTMVPALGDPSASLTALNASSSFYTLRAMAIITAIGLVPVLGYTIWVYRTFRGKVTEEAY